MPKLSHVAAS